MKTFRILAALMMAVVCVGLSSCSKDNDEKIGSTDDLVGKWELIWTKGWETDSDGTKEEWDEADSGQYLTFDKDGTGYGSDDYGTNNPYTWKLDGKKLIVSYSKFDATDTFIIETLNKSTLTITISDDDESDTSTYKKIS